MQKNIIGFKKLKVKTIKKRKEKNGIRKKTGGGVWEEKLHRIAEAQSRGRGS